MFLMCSDTSAVAALTRLSDLLHDYSNTSGENMRILKGASTRLTQSYHSRVTVTYRYRHVGLDLVIG